MGKVFRLTWELNLLLPCLFWVIGIVLAHILQQVTQPAGLASLNRGTGTVLYGRGQLGSIDGRSVAPIPLPFCLYLFYGLDGLLQLYSVHSVLYIYCTLQVYECTRFLYCIY